MRPGANAGIISSLYIVKGAILMLDIKITRAAALKPQPDPDTLVFGKTLDRKSVV